MATPVGRPAKIKPVSLSLDREAVAILHAEAPTQKSHGHFVSRLLFEHKARREARDEAYAELARVYRLPVKDEAVMEK